MYQHFDPHPPRVKCWHCRYWLAMIHEGTAALCGNPMGPRVMAQPERGCCSFDRVPGVDDEPDWVPAPIAWAAAQRLGALPVQGAKPDR